MNQGYIESKSYDIIPKKCVSPIGPMYKKLEQPHKSHRELSKKWDFATKADTPIIPLKIFGTYQLPSVSKISQFFKHYRLYRNTRKN